MTGKRQKHPGSLAFKRGGRYRALQPMALPGERPVPDCPERATGEAREAWERLWESPLSSAIADTDLPALYRWLWWYDQWIVSTKRLAILPAHSEGAKRQLRHLKLCEASLQRLEEAFGMTPLARMRLGITFSEVRSSQARLRASLDDTRDDPRELLREERT
jgi:hypothetical protein